AAAVAPNEPAVPLPSARPHATPPSSPRHHCVAAPLLPRRSATPTRHKRARRAPRPPSPPTPQLLRAGAQSPPHALAPPFSSRRTCARTPAPHSPRLRSTPSSRTASAAAPLRSAAAPPFPPAEPRVSWGAQLS